MRYILKNADVYENGEFKKYPVYTIEDSFNGGEDVILKENLFVFPGFLDVHVHLREPGFFYKETVRTGSLAAAHGGYTDVCAMPNLNPVPDSKENLEKELSIIKKDAVIGVHPYAAITKGEKGEELCDFSSLKEAVAFSDDGRGVQSGQMMRNAMEAAKKEDKIIAAHCEDNSLLYGGYIHDGAYAKAHGHKGISSKSEWAQIKRDVELAKLTGVKYHVCHISTKQSVDIIRQAKKEGVDVTCETAPHYLLLSENDLREDGRFKMNPPLRSEEDKNALIAGIIDGTIDMIATDHAPHSKEEKSRGLKDSLMGVTGLETAFCELYTGLVKTGIIPLNKLISLLSDSPRARFSISNSGLCVWDLNEKYTVNPDEFLSMGKASPFAGDAVYGKCILTIYGGKTVWKS